MRTTRALLLASLLALATAGCGSGTRTYPAAGTDISPAASGDIRVGKTEGAQRVDIDLRHLAPPGRLGAGLSQYAVWVVPEGLSPMLAGILAYDTAQQSGRLHATTPYERFEVLVTAEAEPIGTQPSGIVVLRRSVP